MIFRAKYHGIVARDLRSRAERTSNETQRKKLLAMAYLHEKLAMVAEKRNSASLADQQTRIGDAVKGRRGVGIGAIWVRSPPLQP